MIKVKYQYDKVFNRAEIVLTTDYDRKVMTVDEASTLASELLNAVATAFYDFTASTPNRGSQADGS